MCREDQAPTPIGCSIFKELAKTTSEEAELCDKN
jgi:hypothetical protein